MSSFFFPSSSNAASSSTSPPPLVNDDPHLEITVTPSASAFFAGETFSATIRFHNTRVPHDAPPSGFSPALTTNSPFTPGTGTTSRQVSVARQFPQPDAPYDMSLPQRHGKIGHKSKSPNGRHKTPTMLLSPVPGLMRGEYPYSPGANPSSRAGWPGQGEPTIRSPDAWGKDRGHTRRARSLALGKGHLSPQQMVWALEGQAPPLPRRPVSHSYIPSSHPHSRKVSLSSDLTPSLVESPLASSQDMEAVSEHEIVAPRPQHPRAPSYENAYGAASLGIRELTLNTPPPPSHPYTRAQEPRTTTILWAYTCLVGKFHPSITYIPPDPLLPLRSQLLRQPVGSGSLKLNNENAKDSKWQMTFGTGTIGNSTQPSLTGSLFGLAKDLVSRSAAGSLEEERKRVWNMKDLPVLETPRTLLGIDLKLKEGEMQEYLFTMQLPALLPPTHRGKAFRFAYDLVVSFNVALPGAGKRQKLKDISIPLRVWANVSVSQPLRTYNVLQPVIHHIPSGTATLIDTSKRRDSLETGGIKHEVDSEASVDAYAKHLLDTLETETATPPASNTGRSPRLTPLSPSVVKTSRLHVLSPSSPAPSLPHSPSPLLFEPNGHSPRLNGASSLDVPVEIKATDKIRPRTGSFIQGDDELVEAGAQEGGCGEAVEILSRHSQKVSYDIAKDGQMVAIMTLIKSTFRIGESILGVVSVNAGLTDRHVLSFSAFLESYEVIPENLLPFSPTSAGRIRQPNLTRLLAEYHTSYTVNTAQLSFSLDIPSEATPSFSLSAGTEGEKGGLEWRIRLAFLVSKPGRASRLSLESGSGRSPGLDLARALTSTSEAVHMVPSGNDDDNVVYTASTTLAPVEIVGAEGQEEWRALRTDTVECEIPIRVLAGNTAFIVRPTVQTV